MDAIVSTEHEEDIFTDLTEDTCASLSHNIAITETALLGKATVA
uniref:Transposase n=1 Tax=Heterorhabditis bacteriophora TaxID=37862 RepID=A0A1I7WQ98_HETBA